MLQHLHASFSLLPRYINRRTATVCFPTEWACVCVCVYFASQQCFPAPETGSATLATRGKIQEVQTACLEFQRVLNSSDGATARTRERERENNEQHTVSPKRHKCSNWRAGVTQMARHTQKVNYEAVEGKRQLCRIWANTHVSAETVAAGMSLLSRSNKNPKTQTDPRTCVSRK